MNMIQAIKDIDWLKAEKHTSMDLIEAIEQDFIHLFKAEGIDDDLLEFRLPSQQALINRVMMF